MKTKLVVLQVSSYTELGSIGAEHWYGKLLCDDGGVRKDFELKRILSDQKEIDHLNDKDETSDFSAWKVGDETNRFKSRLDVENFAISNWKTAFPEHDALVVGLFASADPRRPLDARKPEIFRILKCFWDAAQKTGGYEKNYKAMDAVQKEYWGWVCGTGLKRKKRSKAVR